MNGAICFHKKNARMSFGFITPILTPKAAKS